MKKYNLGSKVGKVGTFTSNMLQLFAALVLTMFVIVVGGFLFYIWGSHEVGKRLDIGYGTSTSPRLVQLEIGDKHFAIPQNYIWSRDRWSGGKVTGVNMELSQFDGHFFHGVERVSTCESGLQFIAI